MKLYSLHDTVASVWTAPMIFEDDNVAKIQLANILDDRSSINRLQLNYSGCSLYCLGDFNNEEGSITFEKSFICDLGSLITQERKDFLAILEAEVLRGGNYVK